ncbi:CdaR family transcriptional regulator [Helcococcus kunzii]|uniref:CdaR family transcriptional regulator n=1 Tax=Helcococcus kunzii TaxID=40091 RepID=UPI00389DDA59
MDISQSLASNIVKELKDIISFDLNFMNIKGIIIASTDPTRIGQINGASVEGIRTNKEILVTYTREYENARKGINIPINFENQVIGTIGITGEPQQVSIYANIIKKMTEILITKEWINEVKQREIDKMKLFLENIIFSEKFEDYYAYSMDDKSNKIICCGFTFPKLNDSEFNKNIINFIDKSLSNKIFKAYYTILYNRLIILFDHVNEEIVRETLNDISNKLKTQKDITVFFGTSTIFKERQAASKKYEEANNSLTWLLNIDEDEARYLSFDKMDLGILFRNIENTDIQSFKKKILNNLTKEEISEYKNILKVYSINNGSITKSSKTLFIHKNTLQYKLNKLEKLTGYNPRTLDDFVVLKLAFLLG